MPTGKATKTLALVDACQHVLQQIHPASVRAVCYRLFTMGITASMKKNETDRVSRALTYAREADIIPWGWIVDETREAERVSAFRDPEHYIAVVKRAYRRDRWQEQPHWLEVWSEKGTIRGTIAPVLHAFGITFRVLHGYGSATSVYDIASLTAESDRPLQALYLGDYDCSGMHMSEVDLPTRLDAYGGNVVVRRVALTEDDITFGNLPSFEATTKIGDPRYQWFSDRYGKRCWELDALSPVVLRSRLEHVVEEYIDWRAWARSETAEAAECESLQSILSKWPTAILRHASKCETEASR